MPISVEELEKGDKIDLAGMILSLFEEHSEEAFTFQEITNALFDQGPPYSVHGDFDIEQVRNWMPFNQYLIYGDLRQVYFRITIVSEILSSLVNSGKLKVTCKKNPKPHVAEWSPPFVTYYSKQSTE